MHKHLAYCLLILLVGFQLVLGQGPKPIVVGPIFDYAHKQECGCNFFLVSKDRSTVVFHSDNDAKASNIWMNLNGKDVPLTETKVIRPKGRQLRVGDKILRFYKSGEFEIKLEQTMLTVCDPKDEDCEYSASSVVIRVAKGKQVKTVKATGGCGCG